MEKGRNIIINTGKRGAIDYVKAFRKMMGLKEEIDESKFPEGAYRIDNEGLTYLGEMTNSIWDGGGY
jgi:hypothetical protein